MIRAIELFRNKADECERRAKHTVGKSEQAELMDMCAELHWLSGEVARLQSRIAQLDGSETPVETSSFDRRLKSISQALETPTSGRVHAGI